jgi:hypothetical protein
MYNPFNLSDNEAENEEEDLNDAAPNGQPDETRHASSYRVIDRPTDHRIDQVVELLTDPADGVVTRAGAIARVTRQTQYEIQGLTKELDTLLRQRQTALIGVDHHTPMLHRLAQHVGLTLAIAPHKDDHVSTLCRHLAALVDDDRVRGLGSGRRFEVPVSTDAEAAESSRVLHALENHQGDPLHHLGNADWDFVGFTAPEQWVSATEETLAAYAPVVDKVVWDRPRIVVCGFVFEDDPRGATDGGDSQPVTSSDEETSTVSKGGASATGSADGAPATPTDASSDPRRDSQPSGRESDGTAPDEAPESTAGRTRSTQMESTPTASPPTSGSGSDTPRSDAAGEQPATTAPPPSEQPASGHAPDQESSPDGTDPQSTPGSGPGGGSETAPRTTDPVPDSEPAPASGSTSAQSGDSADPSPATDTDEGPRGDSTDNGDGSTPESDRETTGDERADGPEGRSRTTGVPTEPAPNGSRSAGDQPTGTAPPMPAPPSSEATEANGAGETTPRGGSRSSTSPIETPSNDDETTEKDDTTAEGAALPPDQIPSPPGGTGPGLVPAGDAPASQNPSVVDIDEHVLNEIGSHAVAHDGEVAHDGQEVYATLYCNDEGLIRHSHIVEDETFLEKRRSSISFKKPFYRYIRHVAQIYETISHRLCGDVHSHPSGIPKQSPADKAVSRNVWKNPRRNHNFIIALDGADEDDPDQWTVVEDGTEVQKCVNGHLLRIRAFAGGTNESKRIRVHTTMGV